MKIYKVHVCMIAVIARLKKFSLEEYNSSQPIVFIEARDPDGACYYATHRLTNILLKKDHSIENINFVKEIMHDVRIIKVECPR
jgi:hypothetical protein